MSDAHMERDERSSHTAIRGPRWSHLPTITAGLLGIAVLWSVQMSNASPFLLSLGLSKAWMSLVFLAGPLSGLIVQPIIGVLADRSSSKYGRRRPYMVGGALICAISALVLGFSPSISAFFQSSANSSIKTDPDYLAIWLAVISVYCIDFSMNAAQAADRALLMDILPVAQQARANAWAARLSGIGIVAGYFIGTVDLVKWFPALFAKQMQAVSVIAALFLLTTHVYTAICVQEKVLTSPSRTGKGIIGECKGLWQNYATLPPRIRQIFYIQFFSWIGWFPIIFYSTVYVGEIHKRSNPHSISGVALDAEATRLGSRALLFGSLLSLLATIILPFFIVSPRSGSDVPRRDRWWKTDLARLWMASHLLFAVCMICTLLISSVSSATAIVTLTGLSGAVTQIVPFAMLGENIVANSSTNETIRMGRVFSEDPEREMLVANMDDQELHSTVLADTDVIPRVGSLAGKAGSILGIHNVFVVLPQFVATGISSVIFALFEPAVHAHELGLITPHPSVSNPIEPVNTFALIFQVGGISALIACYFTWKLARES